MYGNLLEMHRSQHRQQGSSTKASGSISEGERKTRIQPGTLPYIILFLSILSLAMVKKAAKSVSADSQLPIPCPSTLSDGLPLPKLIVFDLDYTLWPFWVDTHVTPPLKASADHTSAKDRFGETFAFYHEVPSILSALRHKSILVGCASRTSAPDLGREMLRLLHVQEQHPQEGRDGKRRKAIDFFDHLEIYPGSKITHFNRLHKSTGVAYEDMLFFDDESRNRNVETLGVTMYLLRDGTNRAELDKGVAEWRKRHGHDIAPLGVGVGLDVDGGRSSS